MLDIFFIFQQEKLMKEEVEKWAEKVKSIEEKVREFNELKEKQQKLSLR